MPVHDLGYRGWGGTRTAHILRAFFVARGGVSLVWRRRWLRTMLMIAWFPIIVPAIGIFIFEYSTTDPNMKQAVIGFLSDPMSNPELAIRAAENPDEARHEVWSTLILAFFRYPQLIAMVLLIGLIAPMLVSYDLRSKAYLLYFSRPLSPMEYIVGKSAVVWFLLAMIATFPAMLLYVVGVMLSPNLSVVNETWDIPLRILGASFALIVPTTALALCYSSWTSESRYASFAWFATWVMGFVAYQFLTLSTVRRGPPMPGRRGRRRGPPWQELDIDFDRWRILSPYHILGKVESWIFGLDPTDASVLPYVIVLVVVTVVGIWIVRRRIIARLNE